jgi:type I restriction enzyme, S subunit
MEVMPGYKQTEVGMIPEDWEMKSVHEFAAIKTGPFGTLLKASEYSQGDGVPLISVGEIREGFLKITDHTPRVPEAVIRRLPQYVLRKGDIVFGRKGGVERSALIREEQDGWFLGSDGISIRPSRQCHSEYLAHQFQSHRVQDWLIQNAIGTTMASLNQEILKKVAIPLPPTKAEQEAIAEVLSKTDALIETLEQLIAKKRLLKKGVMQKLLTGKRRLHGFADATTRYKQTDVGVIPEDWEVVCASDACLKIQDGTHFSPKLGGNDHLYITSKNIRFGYLDVSSAQRIDAAQHRLIYKRCDVKKGDLLLTKDGANTGNAALNTLDDEFSLLSSVAFLRFDLNKHNAAYFLQQILTPQGQRQIQDAMAGNAITRLTLEKIKKLRFPIPPTKAEQEAIGEVLSAMDAEIALLEAQLAKYRQLKQGLMQKVLTGRIRLI